MSEKKFEVGQEVFIVYHNAFGRSYILDRIKSISKTRGDIKLENGQKTYSSDGRSKGGDIWSSHGHLKPATVELKNEVAKKAQRDGRLHFVKGFRLADLDDDDLKSVYDLLKQYKYDKQSES